jgi:uncharacterized membrane protein
MSSVHQSVDVDVPISTAYNQWTQFESFPEFMDGVESVTQQDDTHTHWVVKVGGVTREFDAEITEQTPDEVIAWASTGGDTGGHRGRVAFEPLGPDSTRVDIELGWDPEGVVENVGAGLNIDQRQVDKSPRSSRGSSRTVAQRRVHGEGASTTASPGDHSEPGVSQSSVA